MERKPWELPKEMPDGEYPNIMVRAYEAALTEIARLDLSTKELITKHNRLVIELETSKTKLHASQDHYDTLLEKILDKIK